MRPNLDRPVLTHGRVAVIGVQGRGLRILFGVRAHPVIENRVRIDANPNLAHGGAGGQELVFGAVLGAHRAFLVELAQVEQIVDSVPDVVASSRTLVGRRQPQRGHAAFREFLGVLTHLAPEATVGGRVPVKELHHDPV